jgi:DNA polymerase sigma
MHYKDFILTYSYNILIKEKQWKKSIKLIDSAVIPIIKLTSSEQYNNMHIDISLQDSKHYGLKCVDLVKSFMKEYESLEPLIFALKNILKNANLNDPYTVLYINLGWSQFIRINTNGSIFPTKPTRE